jgi:hypothetical protein
MMFLMIMMIDDVGNGQQESTHVCDAAQAVDARRNAAPRAARCRRQSCTFFLVFFGVFV